MQGIDFTEVLTGEGFKNLILAHVKFLTSVDPDELPNGFSEFRLPTVRSSRVTLVQLATRFVPRVAGGTILLMKTHPLVGLVSLMQCLLPDLRSETRCCADNFRPM
jgi:hypothetical protein